MTVLDKLHNASFKGFDFLFLSESTTSGKKTVSHEYPNSNKRFTEELGEIPPKFSMRAIVHGTIDKRTEFENKLRSKGSGVLFHPYYGFIDNVMATTFTSSTSQTEVGVFNFDINFEVISTDFIYVIETVDEFAVTNAADAAKEAVADDFAEKYVPPTKSGFRAAVDAVTGTIEAIQDGLKRIVNPIREAAANVNKVINEVTGEINDIVQTGEQLKNAFSSIYTGVLNIVEIPYKLESFWDSLIDYKSVLGIPLSTALDRSTSGRVEVANNTALVEEQARLTALASEYESIAYKDMKTSDEINDAKEYLNANYEINLNDNVDNYPEDALLIVDNLEVRNAFATLKNNAIEVLNQKLVNSWKVNTINSHLTSFSLLSYRYYRNIDNVNTLINLNEDLNSSGFRHNVDILK